MRSVLSVEVILVPCACVEELAIVVTTLGFT